MRGRRTDRRRCRRSSALHLHASAQPFIRLQTLPTLTSYPFTTITHTPICPFFLPSFLPSFLHSFLPSFLLVFLSPLSSSPLRRPRKAGALPLKGGEARDPVLGDLKVTKRDNRAYRRRVVPLGVRQTRTYGMKTGDRV